MLAIPQTRESPQNRSEDLKIAAKAARGWPAWTFGSPPYGGMSNLSKQRAFAMAGQPWTRLDIRSMSKQQVRVASVESPLAAILLGHGKFSECPTDSAWTSAWTRYFATA